MSGIDLSQFHEVFFEESFEGLGVLESGLLNLDVSAPDANLINNMFRAAHSIKGGAATFGFQQVAEFTHGLESLLDDIRSHACEINDDLVQNLLSSVDRLRNILSAARAGEVLDERIPIAVSTPPGEQATVPQEDASGSVAAPSSTSQTWNIDFVPAAHLFLGGHDPFRMFRELKNLGELVVRAGCDKLPKLDQFNPENCYLMWQLTLTTDAPRAEIEEVFEWIDDEASITLTPVAEEQDVLSAGTEADTGAESPASEPVAILQETPGVGVADTDPAGSSVITQSFAHAEVTSIRVNIERVDQLVNLVGELVITQSMLTRCKEATTREEMEILTRGIERLEENTRELQEHTMRIRMLPIDTVFQRLPRLVRDVSRNLGKDVELIISGAQTEVDKTVLERITDPLTHLIRNSLDHGIEQSSVREVAGKPSRGKIEVKAYHEGGSIVLEVTDDGAGLNKRRILDKAIASGLITAVEELSDAQIHNLIFGAGFSTAEHLSEVSGRGVGMDVVKNNIEQLGGTIQVESEEGVGSRFIIKLPLTLAIIEGQLVRVGDDIFVIPLLNIIESTRVSQQLYGNIAGGTETYRLQDDYIRMVHLRDLYNIRSDYEKASDAIMVITNATEVFGILVDEVLGQQQVVVKSLETNFKLIPTVSGATILGDGTVAMILDVVNLYRASVEVA